MVVCEVCHREEAKYKCPKCNARYCSLQCFISPRHKENDQKILQRKNEGKNTDEHQETNDNDSLDIPKKDELVGNLLKNEKFAAYMKEPVVQFYILTLNEILHNISLTNEYNREGRLEVANKKLANLRSKGLEYNELFEEFCECALDLLGS